MKIGIISTPRSGNSFLRRVLAGALKYSETSEHEYALLYLAGPGGQVFQIHWPREPYFLNFLEKHNAKVVCVARHPLDVFISMLRFYRCDPGADNWLCGHGKLKQIAGQSPTSPAFLDWCANQGARDLLGLVYQWWRADGVYRVRYEDLVGNPRETIARLASDITGEAVVIPQEVLDDNAIEKWRALPNKHGWLGKTDNWLGYFTRKDARRLYDCHSDVFDLLGYKVSGAGFFLTKQQIESRWLAER